MVVILENNAMWCQFAETEIISIVTELKRKNNSEIFIKFNLYGHQLLSAFRYRNGIHCISVKTRCCKFILRRFYLFLAADYMHNYTYIVQKYDP